MPVTTIQPDPFIRPGNHVQALATENVALPLDREVRSRLPGIDIRKIVRSGDRIFKKNGLKIHFTV